MTMVMNGWIALIKLDLGFFHFSSLIADALHLFSDFITDLISLIANKIDKKRATKRYPFGFC